MMYGLQRNRPLHNIPACYRRVLAARQPSTRLDMFEWIWNNNNCTVDGFEGQYCLVIFLYIVRSLLLRNEVKLNTTEETGLIQSVLFETWHM